MIPGQLSIDREITQRRLAATPVDVSGLDANAYAERARPDIRRGCVGCGLVMAADGSGFYRHGARIGWAVIVNERSRVAHVGREYGMTDCGKDATGPSWWWPL